MSPRALSTVARNSLSGRIKWSAGVTSTTASGSFRQICQAASPMQGAVFLPQGSSKMCSRANSGSWRDVSAAWAALVTTRMFAVGIHVRQRSAAWTSKLRSPASVRNCLGLARRLSGQNRVPLPPAMMTRYSMESSCLEIHRAVELQIMVEFFCELAGIQSIQRADLDGKVGGDRLSSRSQPAGKQPRHAAPHVICRKIAAAVFERAEFVFAPRLDHERPLGQGERVENETFELDGVFPGGFDESACVVETGNFFDRPVKGELDLVLHQPLEKRPAENVHRRAAGPEQQLAVRIAARGLFLR